MSSITRLAINGCSYASNYAAGNGHIDLANRLNIPDCVDLSRPGSSNKRIIRTCIKDSFLTSDPTLYIVGLTFTSRTELPILEDQGFEGRWLSISNRAPDRQDYQENWNQSLVDQYIDLRLRTEVHSLTDRMEELMYQLLSLVSDLNHRGHQIVIFMQPEDILQDELMSSKFDPLRLCKNIIDGLAWKAIGYQERLGAKYMPTEKHIPSGIRHILPGEHKILNDFLFDYIQKQKLV